MPTAGGAGRGMAGAAATPGVAGGTVATGAAVGVGVTWAGAVWAGTINGASPKNTIAAATGRMSERNLMKPVG